MAFKHLKSNRLLLRFASNSDLENLHNLHSLEEVDTYNTLGIPVNLEVTKTILATWVKENEKQDIQRYSFAIELVPSKIFVGIIGLNLGKPKYANAEIWFKIHPEFWNKGYATEALNTILNFSFETLKLHRIEAGCAIANVGSIRVLEKVGMIRESHTRELLPLKSGWSDNYGYAKLATD